MIFDTRSTPFLTPARITKKVIAANNRNQNSTFAEEERNEEKYASPATTATFPLR